MFNQNCKIKTLLLAIAHYFTYEEKSVTFTNDQALWDHDKRLSSATRCKLQRSAKTDNFFQAKKVDEGWVGIAKMCQGIFVKTFSKCKTLLLLIQLN